MSEMALIFAFLRHNAFAVLVNTTWQVTLFIIFVWLLILVLRVKTPTTRYGFWLLAVLSPVLFPLLSMLTPQMNLLDIVKVEDAAYHTGRNAASPYIGRDRVSSFSSPTEAPKVSPAAPPAEHVSPTPIEAKRDTAKRFSLPFSLPDFAIAFWLISASFMFIRLAISYRRLLQLKTDAIKLDGGVVQKIVAELGQRMRITRDIELLASEKVACPISFGMFSTTIILPQKVLNDAEKDELEPMLTHELAHIKRYDYLVNLLQRILEAIFFFHPLFYMASHNLTKEREHICDDWVIFLTQKRKSYAMCLTVLLEESSFPQNTYFGMAMIGRQREIVRRIEMILSKERKIQISIHRKAILAILFVGCLVMPLMAGIRIVQSQEEDTPATEQTVENRKIEWEAEELSQQAQEINKLAAELAKKQSEVAQQLEVTLAQNKELMEKLTKMQKQLESTFKDEMWKKQLGDSSVKMQEQLEMALKALESSNKSRSELHANQALQALKYSGGEMQKQLELALQVLENFDKIRWELLKREDKISVALQTYVGSPEDMLKRGNVAEGVLRLRKSAHALKSLRYYTFGVGKSLRAMYLALNYMEQPGLILKLPPQVDDEWTEVAYVEGIEGCTVVESATEKVEAPAGIFENCLKVKTTITGIAKKDKPSDAFLRGTRTMYFAPGVGLVKLEYQHETGHHTEIVLVDYAVQNDTSYFPLAVDNRWTYRWEDGYFAKEERFTEVWTVKEQEEDVYTIHCAMRRAPEADDSR